MVDGDITSHGPFQGKPLIIQGIPLGRRAAGRRPSKSPMQSEALRDTACMVSVEAAQSIFPSGSGSG
jgi:hypothetical protein